MVSNGRTTTTRRIQRLLAIWCLALVAAATGAEADDSVDRCGRAVVSGSTKILKADTHALRSCAVAILEPASTSEIDESCKKLRTPGLRLERIDARVRTRVSRRCAAGTPVWLPDICRGPGPVAGTRIADAETLAECTASASHCTALLSLDSTFEDAVGPLIGQHPENLGYEFNGIPGNTFSSCLDEAPTTTTSTTSTTMSAASTTTTVSASPSTSTTTSVPAPTSTTTTTLVEPGAMQLVITEFMSNPAAQSDAAGEYFEVFNAGSDDVDMIGLTIHDLGSDSFTVSESLVVAPGGYLVFGKSTTAADGSVDYTYGSGMNLTNSSDAIIIARGEEVLDAVVYDATFPLVAGRATELITAAPDPSSNDVGDNWCSSASPLSDGDAGTPHAAAGACAQ